MDFEKLHTKQIKAIYVILCLTYMLVQKRVQKQSRVHNQIILDERKYFYLCSKMVCCQVKYNF